MDQESYPMKLAAFTRMMTRVAVTHPKVSVIIRDSAAGWTVDIPTAELAMDVSSEVK